MIEVRNPHPGGQRDILVFEVYIPARKCLLINLKMRVSEKTNKPYVVFPCMVEEREDGTKRYPHLAQFDEETEKALREEILPQLRTMQPSVFSQLC